MSAAVAAAQDGDIIRVQAGTYTNDFPATINNSITIEGIDGMANFVATESPPNEKGILVIGDSSNNPNVTLINLTFSGVAISDDLGGNGAGVRYQSGNLTINDCYLHDNQEGLLGDADPSGSITISNSEFANNGVSSGSSAGFTHNVYVTQVGTFDISDSLIIAANVGNEIQSRANVNIITDNRIVDGPTATASYSISLPNGGVNIISGNTFEKGPNTGNDAFIGYGTSGSVHSGSSLDVANNVFVNDHPSGAVAILNFTTMVPSFANNSVYGLTSSEISNDPVTGVGTSFLTTEPVISTTPPFCFCAGTLITTERGDVPVEQLTIGDRVLTLNGVLRSIFWIGIGRVLATRGRRTAATPVIVRKGALAENVPHRDLHVTKAHGMYIDNVLIPVEFLVNHRSIYWDDRAQEVSLYHIELAQHDVLLANGAPAETYRDDGNRWLFQNANAGWRSAPQSPCAPVVTGGSIVDAIWRRLLERAAPRPRQILTDDPELHLLVDGQRVTGKPLTGGVYLFYLPGLPMQVRVISRAASPAELGTARDPRMLGVALRRIVLRRGAWMRVMEASDATLSDGFHLFEPDNDFRWTDGDAGLPAALFGDVKAGSQLELEVAGRTQYVLLCGDAVQAAA